MAMQTGMGFSKILILVGAGYTGSIMVSNGRLSELLGDLQSLLKGFEKSGDQSNSSSDASDAVAAQVRRLAMEVRQLASARQITVLNGNSSQNGIITSLAMPAAVVGALGYGYMWWKGLSFSDLMYVTKRNMANAVSSMTKHLEQVSVALAATKRHLTQRIENLDGKLDEQKEISKLIKNEVTDVRADLSQIGYDLDSLQRMVLGLDGKVCSLEGKQDFANVGVWYLCNFVNGKDVKMPEILQAQLKPPSKPRGFLTSPDAPMLKGLKGIVDEIADTIMAGSIDKPMAGEIVQSDDDKLEYHPRSLTRTASIKC